jgi:hypothetical protein
MGAGWNANRVYELASGKYFKRATQDAMIQPDFLRLCVDALEEDDSLVLAHGMTRVIDEGGRFVENYDERLRTSRYYVHETCCSKATEAVPSQA